MTVDREVTDLGGRYAMELMRRSDSNRARDSARDNGLGNVFSGMPLSYLTVRDSTHQLNNSNSTATAATRVRATSLTITLLRDPVLEWHRDVKTDETFAVPEPLEGSHHTVKPRTVRD